MEKKVVRLLQQLKDSNWYVRQIAIYNLAELELKQLDEATWNDFKDELKGELEGGDTWYDQATAAKVISKLGGARAVEMLCEEMTSLDDVTDEFVIARAGIAEALGEIADPKAIDVLISSLNSAWCYSEDIENLHRVGEALQPFVSAGFSVANRLVPLIEKRIAELIEIEDKEVAVNDVYHLHDQLELMVYTFSLLSPNYDQIGQLVNILLQLIQRLVVIEQEDADKSMNLEYLSFYLNLLLSLSPSPDHLESLEPLLISLTIGNTSEEIKKVVKKLLGISTGTLDIGQPVGNEVNRTSYNSLSKTAALIFAGNITRETEEEKISQATKREQRSVDGYGQEIKQESVETMICTGLELCEGDAEVLEELEKIVGEIPVEEEIPLLGPYDSPIDRPSGMAVEGKRVTELALYSCGLTELPELLNLTGLRKLILTRNRLTALPETLGQLAELKALDARGNELTGLPKAIQDLTGLKTLSLGSNRLKTLPKWFANLEKLEYLDLRNNGLTILLESTGKLGNLRRLFLDNNQLKILPESFGRLTNLQELRLDENQLVSLPKSFGQLKNLRKLVASHNQLSALPESFSSLTNLQELHLQENQLTAFPESFGELEKLRRLFLDSNRLKTLPKSFGGLTNLQRLELQKNPLTALPESFGQLSGLQVLHLGFTGITALSESFGSLISLRELMLYDNPLTALPESFGRLISLQRLNLSRNHLVTLPESFSNLTSLERLDLKGNQLSSIPGPLLLLTNLKVLTLDDNHLVSLPESLGDMTGLRYLGLRFNPLDSRSRQLLETIKERGCRVEY